MKYISHQQTVEALQITEKWFSEPHPNTLHPIGVIISPKKRIVYVDGHKMARPARIGEWMVTPENGKACVYSDEGFKMLYKEREGAPF